MHRLEWIGAHEDQGAPEPWLKVRALNGDSDFAISNLCRFYFPDLNDTCSKMIQAGMQLGHLDYREFCALTEGNLLERLDSFDAALHELGEAFYVRGGTLFRMRKEDLFWPSWVFRRDSI
jgi:hypothetical protein